MTKSKQEAIEEVVQNFANAAKEIASSDAGELFKAAQIEVCRGTAICHIKAIAACDLDHSKGGPTGKGQTYIVGERGPAPVVTPEYRKIPYVIFDDGKLNQT